MKELLNVSQVEVTIGPSPQVIVTTLPADGKKCERCWNYSMHVGEDWRWPTVCERCSAALDQMGVPPAESRMKVKDSRGWLLLLSVLVVAADRVTKWLAATRIEVDSNMR